MPPVSRATAPTWLSSSSPSARLCAGLALALVAACSPQASESAEPSSPATPTAPTRATGGSGAGAGGAGGAAVGGAAAGGAAVGGAGGVLPGSGGSASSAGGSGGGPGAGGAPFDALPGSGGSPAATDASAPSPGVSDPGSEGDGNVTVNPPYNLPPEATLAPGVTAGKLHEVMVASTTFAGRTVQVHIPHGYVPGTPVPFMVLHDGPSYIRNFKLDVVLDNLIARKQLPLMVAIFVPNGGARRSIEYDTLSDANAKFILEDVLPAVEKSLPVKLTTDPEGRSIGGHSSGGIAAFTVGWHRPEQFHRILTHSGSFVSLRGGDKYPAMVKATAAKPLRVFLSVGTKDLENGRWLRGNVALAAALAEQKYHYRFVTMNDGTHAQGHPAALLPETLRWLWRGYPITP